ncbi:Uncharacterised protein [uncultured archaeon]|nr:Uncharacterised protein [uncultured archaeon]
MNRAEIDYPRKANANLPKPAAERTASECVNAIAYLGMGPDRATWMMNRFYGLYGSRGRDAIEAAERAISVAELVEGLKPGSSYAPGSDAPFKARLAHEVSNDGKKPKASNFLRLLFNSAHVKPLCSPEFEGFTRRVKGAPAVMDPLLQAWETADAATSVHLKRKEFYSMADPLLHLSNAGPEAVKAYIQSYLRYWSENSFNRLTSPECRDLMRSIGTQQQPSSVFNKEDYTKLFKDVALPG